MQRKRGSLTVAMALFTVLDQRGMTICSEDLREGTGLLEKEGFNSEERAQYRIYGIYPADPSQQVQTSWLIHLVQLMYI